MKINQEESVTISDDSVSETEIPSPSKNKLSKNLNIRHPNHSIKEVDEDPISVSSSKT